MFDNSEDSVESLISLTILLESLGPGHWGTDHRRLIIDTQIISKCFKKFRYYHIHSRYCFAIMTEWVKMTKYKSKINSSIDLIGYHGSIKNRSVFSSLAFQGFCCYSLFYPDIIVLEMKLNTVQKLNNNQYYGTSSFACISLASSQSN